MKILITTDLYATETNGVVTAICNLQETLPKKGTRCAYTHRNRHHPQPTGGFRLLHPLGIAGEALSQCAHAILLSPRVDSGADFLATGYHHSQCEFFSFQFASHISKETGAPIVHTYHTQYEQYVSYILPSKRIERKFRAIQKAAGERGRHHCAYPQGGRNPAQLWHPKRYMIHFQWHIAGAAQAEAEPGGAQQKRHALGISDNQTVLLNLGCFRRRLDRGIPARPCAWSTWDRMRLH